MSRRLDIGRDNGGGDLSYEDKAVPVHWHRQKVVFDVKPHLSTDDEDELHAATHRPRRARAVGLRHTRRPQKEGLMRYVHETTDVLISDYLSKDAAQQDYEAAPHCRGAVRRARQLGLI